MFLLRIGYRMFLLKYHMTLVAEEVEFHLPFRNPSRTAVHHALLLALIHTKQLLLLFFVNFSHYNKITFYRQDKHGGSESTKGQYIQYGKLYKRYSKSVYVIIKCKYENMVPCEQGRIRSLSPSAQSSSKQIAQIRNINTSDICGTSDMRYFYLGGLAIVEIFIFESIYTYLSKQRTSHKDLLF